VYGIVQQHNAFISVESAPGRGTTFRIHFPPDTRAPAARPKAADEKTGLRGTETVLVVEDDPAVRRLTTACLRAQGYAILAAESGPQAIEVARGAPRIDAAIVDIGLPDMPGTDVARRLRERWPDLKIVFVSGYRSEDVPADGPFLAKPFTAPELAKTMRAVLDGAKSAQ
jgi:CheY-like chemotaxis protein